MTDSGNFLSSVFKNGKSLSTQTKQFIKRLKYCISQCFRKIRIGKTKRNKKLDSLFSDRRILKNKNDEESYTKLQSVELKLAEMCADDNFKIIKEACSGLTCDTGGINAGKLWKLKRKLKGIQKI